MPEIYFITFLFLLVFVTLASAFAILLIDKLGVRNAIIERAPKLISQLFSCDFCLSFWTSLFMLIILAILIGNVGVIYLCILATPIIRLLI